MFEHLAGGLEAGVESECGDCWVAGGSFSFFLVLSVFSCLSIIYP